MLNHDPAKPKSRMSAFRTMWLCLVPLVIVTLQTSSAYGQAFGTVFTSPEEREYLDYLRDDFVRRSQLDSFNIQEDIIPDIPEVEEEEPVREITEYNFGGIMERRNGSRMVWLNGRQIAEADLPNNTNLTQTGMLLIRNNGTTYQLKPGESVNLAGPAANEAEPEPVEQEEEPAAEEAGVTENAQASATAESLIIPEGEFSREQAINTLRNSLDNGNLGEQEADIAQAMLAELENGENNATPDPSP